MNTRAEDATIPVAVIGCGRMGRLHARVYSQMPNVRLVGVYDAISSAAEASAREYGTKAFADLEELLPQIQAASIAVPTQFHLAVAQPLLARRIACLIEKPMARDVTECQRIVDAAERSGAIVQVGHIERFNPAVVALRKLALEPRYIEAIRVSPMPFRSLDVGVVLDVMIHDLDIILSLVASKPSRVDASGVSVIGGHEDVCNARITFENGCVANITASRLALKTERKLRVFSPDAFVSIDYQKKSGVIARRSANVEAIRRTIDELRTGQIPDPSKLNFGDLVKLEPLAIGETEPARAQLDAFINSVAHNISPPVCAQDGLAAVALAHQIVTAIGPDANPH